MPQTVTATVIGRLKSRVAAAALSNAAVASLDVLTVVHGLPASPTMVSVQIRSVSLFPTSQGAPMVNVRSWNASQVLIDMPAGVGATTGAACNVLVDVWCEVTHTLVA